MHVNEFHSLKMDNPHKQKNIAFSLIMMKKDGHYLKLKQFHKFVILISKIKNLETTIFF